MAVAALPEQRTTATAYAAAVAAVRRRVLELALRSWDQLGQYREAEIERLTAKLAPLVVAGQIRIAALTDAYLARVEAEEFGERVAPLGVPAKTVTTLAVRGVAFPTVYRRIGVAVWAALADGDPFTLAVRKGRARLDETVATDLQLAKTHASRYIIERRERVVGFRRNLEGSDSCALCMIASTQRYRKGDLLPIHARCDCSVSPIFGDRDPGRVIDRELLAELHAKVRDRVGADAVRRDATSAAAYHDLLAVHHHGEIGPVLAVAGQHFDGPNDL